MNFLTFLTNEYECGLIEFLCILWFKSLIVTLMVPFSIIFIYEIVPQVIRKFKKPEIKEIQEDDFVFDVSDYEDFDIFTPLKDQES